MENRDFNVKIDLSKLRGAQKIESKTAGIGVFIPFEPNEIFVSEKTGGMYLSLRANSTLNGKIGQSHYIKKEYSKTTYAKMTDEERQNIPFIGNLFPVVKDGERKNYPNQQPQQQANVSMPSTQQSVDAEDLPF